VLGGRLEETGDAAATGADVVAGWGLAEEWPAEVPGRDWGLKMGS